MKFRKKPVVIEAVQYMEYGKLVKGMCNSQSCYASGNTEPHVHTIHEGQLVNIVVGDWIIPEPDGVHCYPCKPDIFEATYEPAEILVGDEYIPIVNKQIKHNDPADPRFIDYKPKQ